MLIEFEILFTDLNIITFVLLIFKESWLLFNQMIILWVLLLTPVELHRIWFGSLVPVRQVKHTAVY